MCIILMICCSFLWPLNVAEAAVDKFTAVAAGYSHSCAITVGEVWCWGSNVIGQLGNPSANGLINTKIRVVKRDNTPLRNVISISLGLATSCAITGGFVWCWGSNTFGQLGNNTNTDSNVAVRVNTVSGIPLQGVNQISVGGSHTCARTKSNRAWCWGANILGQLGDGSETNRFGAVEVRDANGITLSGIFSISTGRLHTCAIVRGSVMCWGYNSDGQLGSNPIEFVSPDRFSSASPVSVVRLDTGVKLTGVTSLSSGDDHTCASTTTDIWCWGENTKGQLGNRTTVTAKGAVRAKKLTPNVSIAGANKLAAGSNFTCVIARDGVWCWGANDSGQLGDNTTTQRLAAVKVKSATTTPLFTVGTAIEAGDKHTCASAVSGVWCWGYNSAGQLDGKTQVERHAAFRVYW